MFPYQRISREYTDGRESWNRESSTTNEWGSAGFVVSCSQNEHRSSRGKAMTIKQGRSQWWRTTKYKMQSRITSRSKMVCAWLEMRVVVMLVVTQQQ